MKLAKSISILSATAIALGTAIPAFAEVPEPSAGEQTGTGKTTFKLIVDGTEYGGTEAEGTYSNPNSTGQYGDTGYDADAPGSNLAFTAPTELDFVVKANGDMLCPSASATAIHNASVYGIHVSSVDIDSPAGWNLVTDANFAAATSANTVSMNMGPATDDTEKISIANYMNKANLTNGSAKWSMSAAGADQNKDKLYLNFDGKTKNLNAGYESFTAFAEIHWYLSAGGEGTRYIDPTNRVAIHKLETSNGSFKVSSSSSGTDDLDYAAADDVLYIVAAPSDGYVVNTMSVTTVSDNSNVSVTKDSPNVGHFTLPSDEVNVSVSFKSSIPALPANQLAVASTSLSDLSEIGDYLRSGSADASYVTSAEALVGATMNVTLNGNVTMTVRLSDVSTTRGLTFEAVNCLPTMAPMNSSETNSGGWADSELRATLNEDGDLYTTCFDGTVLAAHVHEVTNYSYDYASPATPAVSQDKFWIPSANNIYGAGWPNWYDGSGSYSDGSSDGQFDYYANLPSPGVFPTASDGADVLVKRVGGSEVDWWLRSAYPGDAYSFMEIRDDACLDFDGADNSQGVALCFCL